MLIAPISKDHLKVLQLWKYTKRVLTMSNIDLTFLKQTPEWLIQLFLPSDIIWSNNQRKSGNICLFSICRVILQKNIKLSGKLKLLTKYMNLSGNVWLLELIGFHGASVVCTQILPLSSCTTKRILSQISWIPLILALVALAQPFVLASKPSSILWSNPQTKNSVTGLLHLHQEERRLGCHLASVPFLFYLT